MVRAMNMTLSLTAAVRIVAGGGGGVCVVWFFVVGAALRWGGVLAECFWDFGRMS